MMFKAPLIRLDSNVWSHAFEVPEDFHKSFSAENRRFKISINGSAVFSGAAMNGKEGSWFFNVNRKRRSEFSLLEGDLMEITLEEDKSEFGMDMPIELQELLYQDEEGLAQFNSLTPGKQRNLIYIVSQVKSSEIKIRRALVVVNHLKITKAKIDFKALNQELKSANQAARNQ